MHTLFAVAFFLGEPLLNHFYVDRFSRATAVSRKASQEIRRFTDAL
jgi:hypothetical protein